MRAEAPDRTGVVATPQWVSRVNLFPHTDLRDEPAALASTTRGLERLAAEEGTRTRLAPLLVDQLHAWVPVVDEADRRAFVLPLKRDVFNGRAPRPGHLAHRLAGDLVGLDEWAASWARTADLEAELDAAHARAEHAERQVLAHWSADPDVQRSLAVTSGDLLGAVERRDRVAVPDRRTRKSESALVQYFSRSTVRVSPFSLYTGVVLQRWDEEQALDGPLGRTSVPALRRLLVRQAVRRLVDDPADAEHVPWRRTDAFTVVDGTLVVRRCRWQAATRAQKADTFTEDEVRVPMTDVLAAVLAALPDGEHAAPRTALVAALRETGGWDADGATRLVAQLVEMGLLVPAFGVREQSSTFEQDWLDALDGLPGRASRDVRDALRATLDALDGFAEADGPARARTLVHLGEGWATAVGGPASDPVVEDVYVTRGQPVTAATLDGWVADATRILPLLAAHDDQRVLAGALETVFVERYGAGARCTDLRELARVAYACFPLTQRLLSGERPADLPEHVVGLLAAREIAVRRLVDLTRAPHDEAVLDDAALAEITAALPPAELDVARSVSLFGQVGGSQLVLNHAYGGRARYFSRYLHHADPDVTRLLREHNAGLVPSGALPLHMRPTLGFNANLGPLLPADELALTDEPRPGPGALTIDDLHLVHTPAGLRLRTARDDQDVDLLYTGFLVPHALPSEQMLLAMLAGAPYFSFSGLGLDLHARWTAGADDARRGTARVLSGDLVLFRRRWALPATVLDARPGETPQAHFRRVNAERSARGIPDQVFVRPLLGRQITPVERAMSPKPQHVDFLSRLHVRHAARRLAHLGPLLVVEELSPHPEHGVRSDRGTHATEIFFEINAGWRQS